MPIITCVLYLMYAKLVVFFNSLFSVPQFNNVAKVDP